MKLPSALLDSVNFLGLSLYLCNLIGSGDIKILSASRDFFSSRTLIFLFQLYCTWCEWQDKYFLREAGRFVAEKNNPTKTRYQFWYKMFAKGMEGVNFDGRDQLRCFESSKRSHQRVIQNFVEQEINVFKKIS